MRHSIRWQLSIWYASALVVLMLLYSGSVLVFVWRSMSVDLDHRLREDFEIAASMFERTADDRIFWHWSFDHEGEGLANLVSAQAWSPEGELLGHSDATIWLGKISEKPQSNNVVFGHLVVRGGKTARYLEGPLVIDGREVVVRVYRSEGRLHEILRKLALAGLLVLPLGVILAIFGGNMLAGRLLAPIRRIADHAEAITAERLSERLPVDLPDDEVGRLASVFNRTFARLERSFLELRRFTADASHELRTPLTSIRSVGEVALREHRDAEAYRETIGSMLEESDKLTQLVDTLLTLSRADGEQMKLKRERVDLAEMARAVVDDLGVLAEEKRQPIFIEAAEGVLTIADRDVLHRAFVNLIDNAIKYSPEESPIRIVVAKEGKTAVAQVIDKGCGIAASQAQRVFERFYRVDKSRSRKIGGTGLGLAIARWAVELNGGVLELESEEGAGSVFTIRLPLSP